MLYGDIENRIAQALEKALYAVLAKKEPGATGEIRAEMEFPKESGHGDLSSNIAMKAAKYASSPPMPLAEKIKDQFLSGLEHSGLKEAIDKVDVKQPGFINFFLSRKYLYRSLLEITRQKASYGRSGIGRGMKVQVEFVSANPTGPLTIAHGRQAAIGDSLANILQYLGYKVVREYYLNDEGTQMDILANSVRSRYQELNGIKEEFPADGYKGAYIKDIAGDLKKKYGKKLLNIKELDRFRSFGLKWILDDIKKDLKEFGVRFDVWYSQKRLRRSGKVAAALDLLKEKGYIYEQEGAVWFASKKLGDDKDRVVIKSDGSNTYLAPDIAYHQDKYKRGFKRIVDIWGPDHHGYIPRMRSAVKALGYSDDSLSILIVQLATLYKAGQVVSMSTRAGEFVTLREVMDEVGKDVSRFCFIMRRISSHLDFDLDAVKKESMDNPVYYIQYAHARICSIIDFCGKKKVLAARFDSALLKEDEEIAIIRSLRCFPHVVAMSGKLLEPYVVLQYLEDLAVLFHSFYNKHRVAGDSAELTKARLVLVNCVKIVLANGLKLLGVSLPEKM